ncbi:MAG TPA: DNA polymerase III subunit delta [Chloroflexota bacterium]|nr:DNA polymerase III subunit delta [Chloroflexota bacterium]
MIYLLRDDFFGEERLAALRDRLGPVDFQSLNTTILDGTRLSIGELRGAASALPFLGERRLVIVRRFLGTSTNRGDASDDASSGSTSRRGGRGASEREQELLTYLPQVPESTDLVLVEDRDFSADHPVPKAIKQLGGELQTGGMPRGDQLLAWVNGRIATKGGRIERAAQERLAGLAVDDLRQLDLILDLLVTYADGRAIQVSDIETLVEESHDLGVFDLVDAVGAGDRTGALRAYHHLLANNVSPIYVLVMLTRQIRLLLIAHEAQTNREDLAGALKLPPRVAQKLGRQARSFGVDRCIAAMQRLAEIDQAIKTGQATEEVAVELLIVGFTGRSTI